MWEFHSSYAGRTESWSWKRFYEGRLSSQSRPGLFQTIRDALADAGLHGFEIHLDRWEICVGGASFNLAGSPLHES